MLQYGVELLDDDAPLTMLESLPEGRDRQVELDIDRIYALVA